MKKRKINWALVAVLFLVLGGFGYIHQNNHIEAQNTKIETLAVALKANIESQVPNRVKNVEAWCEAGINADRRYDRGYFNTTLERSEEEATKLHEAVVGNILTPKHLAFAEEYVGTLTELEQKRPDVLKIHPYILPDLPCEEIERKTAESAHIKS